MRKNLNPNILPVKQHASPIKASIEKPHIGQGRAGLRRKGIGSKQSNYYSSITAVTENSWRQKMKQEKTNHVNSTDPMHSINNADEGMTHTRPLIPRCSLLSRSNLQSPSQTN